MSRIWQSFTKLTTLIRAIARDHWTGQSTAALGTVLMPPIFCRFTTSISTHQHTPFLDRKQDIMTVNRRICEYNNSFPPSRFHRSSQATHLRCQDQKEQGARPPPQPDGSRNRPQIPPVARGLILRTTSPGRRQKVANGPNYTHLLQGTLRGVQPSTSLRLISTLSTAGTNHNLNLNRISTSMMTWYTLNLSRCYNWSLLIIFACFC